MHCEDPIYEELQSLALGMSIRIKELESQLEQSKSALKLAKVFARGDSWRSSKVAIKRKTWEDYVAILDEVIASIKDQGK